MTVILTPYWSDGTQRLKVEHQRASTFCCLSGCHADCHFVLAAQPPPRGLFPAAYDSTLHATRCLAQLRSKDKPIEKYIYLSQLKHANEELFYRLCLTHMPVCNNRSSPSRIELGIGIYAYYIHPHCRGCVSSAFSHFPSPRRIGMPRDASLDSFIDHSVLVYFHQG
jgi:hypothetical protein